MCINIFLKIWVMDLPLRLLRVNVSPSFGHELWDGFFVDKGSYQQQGKPSLICLCLFCPDFAPFVSVISDI